MSVCSAACDWPPNDPRSRTKALSLGLGGEHVIAHDDCYSDRIRCDHPEVSDGRVLGEALVAEAKRCGRGRIVVLAPTRLRIGLEQAGYVREVMMPGFYHSVDDCLIAGYWLDKRRRQRKPVESQRECDRLIQASNSGSGRVRKLVTTQRAGVDDARGIAALITASFRCYPTPSGDPDYVAGQIEAGTPFRVVRADGRIVACACAARVESALAAELTDCATQADHRGRGLMQSILVALVEDLRMMKYETAFTLARAREVGMNLAFQRLGFQWCGQMVQSCRIGTGMEDMNAWCKPVVARTVDVTPMTGRSSACYQGR